MKILLSPGFGVGWSTWNREYPDMLTDPNLINLLEKAGGHYQDASKDLQKEIEQYCENKWPEAYFGGLEDLRVVGILPGTAFMIKEYDGSENINFKNAEDWITAT